MTVRVESTTDSNEQVLAATGNLRTPKEAVPAAAEPSKEVEQAESSSASGVEEEQESEETGDSKEDAEEEAEEGEEEEKSSKKPKNGFKKRIDKLSKQKSQAEQERDYWREQALKGQPREESAPEVKAPSEGKPKAEDFESHEDYIEALTDWRTEQKFKAKEAKQKETEEKAQFQKQVDGFKAGCDALREKHEDYDDVIDAVGDVIIPRHLQRILLESKDGPELGYHLAKNREEFARICKLPDIDAARALGKFEASLASKAQKPEAKTTKAPAPINPVGSKSAGTSQKNPSEMSYADYKRWRERNH